MSGDEPKVAFYWCASCGGCEEAVVDIAFTNKLLDVINAVNIVFWPVAVDAKKEDVEKMNDGEILVSFINGAVRLSEQEDMVKLLRRKSKLIVAYGSCSYTGGIPSLANLFDRERVFNYVYKESPTVENREETIPKTKIKVPEGELELPLFYNTVRALDQVIEVDYYIPGCPATPEVTLNAIQTLLSGELSPKGSVIGASNRSLCDECPLNETKPEKLSIEGFRRLTEVKLDLERCFLAQSVICLGPVTRGGCDARCIKGGRPCQGCFGPLNNVLDYGARAASYIASILNVPPDYEKIEEALKNIPDPIGIFYKFSLAKSLFRGKVMKKR